MELKLLKVDNLHHTIGGLNCTFMELKCANANNTENSGVRLNCTFMELKLRKRMARIM